MPQVMLVTTLAFCASTAFGAQLDGKWEGSLNCGPLLVEPSSPAFSHPASMTVQGRVATFLRESDRYREELRGQLHGNEVSLDGDGYFKSGNNPPWTTKLQGHFSGTKFEGKAVIYGKDGTPRRNCAIALSQASSPTAVTPERSVPEPLSDSRPTTIPTRANKREAITATTPEKGSSAQQSISTPVTAMPAPPVDSSKTTSPTSAETHVTVQGSKTTIEDKVQPGGSAGNTAANQSNAESTPVVTSTSPLQVTAPSPASLPQPPSVESVSPATPSYDLYGAILAGVLATAGLLTIRAKRGRKQSLDTDFAESPAATTKEGLGCSSADDTGLRTYQVKLGGPKEGMERAHVRNNLAALFKTTPEQVDHLLSSPGHVLKSGLSDELARRYRSAIEAAGCSADIVATPPPETLVVNWPEKASVGPETTRLSPIRQKVNLAAGALFGVLLLISVGRGILDSLPPVSSSSSATTPSTRTYSSPDGWRTPSSGRWACINAETNRKWQTWTLREDGRFSYDVPGLKEETGTYTWASDKMLVVSYAGGPTVEWTVIQGEADSWLMSNGHFAVMCIRR
jgi:hypothetical protein